MVKILKPLKPTYLCQQEKTPVSDGLTALGFYSLMCLTFVFMAMVEYAVILLIIRRANHRKSDANLPKPNFNAHEGKETFNQVVKIWKEKVKRGKVAEKIKDDLCYQMDRMAFIVFSAAFIIFNVIYLTVYG